MKFPSMMAAAGLMFAGITLGNPALAAGLPLAGYRPLKLPAFTAHEGPVGLAIYLTPGQIAGTVTAMDEETFRVALDEETEYTVDISLAAFVNTVGFKAKRQDVSLGDRVVIDGYIANRSTGMSARRVINVGPGLRP